MQLTKKQELWASKGLTVFWGALCTFFAFYVGDVSDSIIVSINKIGSLLNGPILGIFLLGVLTKRVNANQAIIGFLTGFIINFCFWIFLPDVTWPWWNAIGCAVTFAVGILLSLILGSKNSVPVELTHEGSLKLRQQESTMNWNKYYAVLSVYGLLIIAFCIYL